jgi:magnesium transporter
MIIFYPKSNPSLPKNDLENLTKSDCLWIDLLGDDNNETQAVENVFGVDIVTQDEVRGIEESARFYEDEGNLYLNIFVPARIGARPYEPVPPSAVYHRSTLGLVLTPDVLISYHEHALKALETGKTRASVRLEGVKTSAQTLLVMLEALIERQAGLLARIGNDLDDVSLPVLAEKQLIKAEPRLKKLGQLGAQLALCRDCLFDLARMNAFLHSYEGKFGFNRDTLNAFKDDIADLLNLNQSQTNDLTFLLDATLGLINARQSRALSFMAVVTLLFAPPTLLASVFGMNFSNWSIFNSPHGHWFAISLMAVSALMVLLIARIARLF